MVLAFRVEFEAGTLKLGQGNLWRGDTAAKVSFNLKFNGRILEIPWLVLSLWV